MEQSNLERIGKDRQETDRLIRELDLAKQDNQYQEEEQIRLLEQIQKAEDENHYVKTDLDNIRQQASIQDQANLNMRKEIEYHESMVNEQKDISHANNQQLLNLRDV